jgi:23S rRNA (uracil1939-C5)-methyltransferase
VDELTLQAEKLIWRGRSLARLSSGQVVIVEPGAFPGEVLKAEVTKRKKDYLQARVLQILEPHPNRRPHPCFHSSICGGCPFGVLPNRVQLELKQGVLQAELARGLPAGQRLPRCTALQSPKGWRYRWRGQVHVRGGRPHSKALRSDREIPVADCFLLARPLGRSLHSLSGNLPDGRHTIAASPLDNTAVPGSSGATLQLPLTGLDRPWRIPAGTFFQANWSMNQDLVRAVSALLQPCGAVADLFAGGGNFALPLARQGHEVLAVEADPSAVAASRANARRMGLNSLQAVQADLTRRPVRELLARFNPDAAIVDPPRAGGGRHIAGLADMDSLRRIVWISCDVVNSARDLKPFLRRGWEVTSLKLFDMFPQTWHMEVVMVLDRG